jgi:hypothetical protein
MVHYGSLLVEKLNPRRRELGFSDGRSLWRLAF